MKHLFDKIMCKLNAHELKPVISKWRNQIGNKYNTNSRYCMQWSCGKCLYTLNVYKPTDKDIELWNKIAEWPESRRVYIESKRELECTDVYESHN